MSFFSSAYRCIIIPKESPRAERNEIMIKNEDKKSFVMYKSFRKLMLRLPMEERGRLISAIFEHLYDGEVSTELSDAAAMALDAITDTLDRDCESYAERCRINAENGKKGGRPRKSERDAVSERPDIDFSYPKTERFFEKAKKADNDNNNDNGAENENKNENDTVYGDEDDNGAENYNECGFRSAALSVSDLPHPKESGFLDSQKGTGATSSVLTDGERDVLVKSGIPESYINERVERAAYFAKRQKMRVAEVLGVWWESDKNKPLSLAAKCVMSPGGSFDTDEFFKLAAQRSLHDL